MQRNIVVTIMAGGAGTRFWPMSREERPKQFINLTGERTMLQETRARLEGLVPPERILVLTNARYADLAREQLPDLPPENVVGEPMLRDTAAAVALSAAISERRWPGSVQAVLAADHIIRPSSRFQEILLSAAEAAEEEGGLYTFGIVPRHPATGYGYLERGEQVGARYGAPHFRLKRFCEKPSREVAEQFVASGDFYWNSGIFVWKSADILAEIATHLPEHHERIVAAAEHFGQSAFDAALTTAFEPLKKISIDFGVMEKAKNVRCVAADFEWNDVGGWLALEQVLPRDSDGNWTQAKLLALDSRDNIVVSEESGHRIVAIGVSDLVVVHTAGATLVCRKDEAERIKAAVERLRETP